MQSRKPFSDRRFSDSELARILDEATKSEARSDLVAGPPEGYTLEEIRDIAREAGIDPSHVDRAAAGLLASDESPRPTTGRFTLARLLHEELVTAVHDELVIDRSLTDDEMLSVVHQLESILPWRGRLRQFGNWVEWRDVKDRLYLGVVRGNDQTRIRVIANQLPELQVGAAAISMGSMMAMAGLGGFVALLPVGIVGLGTIGIFWKWRTRVTRGRLRELLEIIEGVFGR
jgi:hypothetical protein